jgi:hypothetical protein
MEGASKGAPFLLKQKAIKNNTRNFNKTDFRKAVGKFHSSLCVYKMAEFSFFGLHKHCLQGGKHII